MFASSTFSAVICLLIASVVPGRCIDRQRVSSTGWCTGHDHAAIARIGTMLASCSDPGDRCRRARRGQRSSPRSPLGTMNFVFLHGAARPRRLASPSVSVPGTAGRRARHIPPAHGSRNGSRSRSPDSCVCCRSNMGATRQGGCSLGAGRRRLLGIIFGQRAGRAHGSLTATWGLIGVARHRPSACGEAGTRLLAHDVWPRGLAIAALSARCRTLEMIALRRPVSPRLRHAHESSSRLARRSPVWCCCRNAWSVVQWAGIVAVMIASAGRSDTSRRSEPEP